MFNEASLENAIMQKFANIGYIWQKGDEVQRLKTEVLIKPDLYAFLKRRYPDITDNELARVCLLLNPSTGSDYLDNKQALKLIQDGIIINREDTTQKDFHLDFIDYDNINNNTFKIVNQLEVMGKCLRIPDGVIYINGIPLVVFEFKSATKEETTIKNAYDQLCIRYRRDIPELFKTNALTVISDGANTKMGSLFTQYEHYYAWNKIDGKGLEKFGMDSLDTMLEGLFNKERLPKVIKDYIYFADGAKEEKIVCRYPQFYGAEALYDSIKANMKPTGNGKGGTYFGSTGCGKSYTMLFLTRKLMRSHYFASPTVLLITDRQDLDDQLGKQFTESKEYIGDENVKTVQSRADLKEKLEGIASGGVFLTTIQKFSENTDLLSNRANIICISDEAHRTQTAVEAKTVVSEKGVTKKYGFAKYLRDSLPNATYVGFTGTPIDDTLHVFGRVVDSYTMAESVQDEITVNLVYEGRAAKVSLDNEKLKEADELYDYWLSIGTNEYQVDESKRAMSRLKVVIGDPDRLDVVAKDFIQHYEARVNEGASICGKAMYVAFDRAIAFEMYKRILDLRPQWENKVKMVMTKGKDDIPEMYDAICDEAERKELDKEFKKEDSEFKIAIVVDMWTTGFDVKPLDMIYIDKPISKHTLIQTISRVNRKFESKDGRVKDNGLIVDYLGIKKEMDKAIRQYSSTPSAGFEGIEDAIVIFRDTLEVIDDLFCNYKDGYFEGDETQQLDNLKKAVEYVQRYDDSFEKRFMANAMRLKKAYNLCVSSEEISSEEREKAHFYFAVRSLIFKLTIGTHPDVSEMNETVKKIVEQAIQSDGVEELFKQEEKVKIDIFSDEYLEKILNIPLENTKIKILEQLLKQEIDELGKVNKILANEFGDKLKKLVDNYNKRRLDLIEAQEVMGEVRKQLVDAMVELRQELKEEKFSFEKLGIDYEEKAFYDILLAVSKKYDFECDNEQALRIAKKLRKIVANLTLYPAWNEREDILAQMSADITILLAKNGYPPVVKDGVYKEMLEAAKNFRKYAEVG